MILKFQLIHFFLSLFLFSSITSAWPWPPSLRDLDRLLMRRQDNKSQGLIRCSPAFDATPSDIFQQTLPLRPPLRLAPNLRQPPRNPARLRRLVALRLRRVLRQRQIVPRGPQVGVTAKLQPAPAEQIIKLQQAQHRVEKQHKPRMLIQDCHQGA